ncbi:MFS transporter [Sphingomonas floccifaciens]|uniref:MFS transporter n=1 Tax=Sphingomonas floccifaciens TaxID=1844115 RepID=A0ABW4NJX1_9SPHN
MSSAIPPVADASRDTLVEPSPLHEDATGRPPLARAVVAFAFLMVAEFFYSWAWNSVDVLRPFMRDTLGLTLTQAGSGYSAQGAGALVGAVVIGQLADRFGRRAMLALVMVGYGATLIAGSFVNGYPAYLAQRVVLGLFMGGIFPIVVGIYVGLFSRSVRGRLASLINAIFSSAITMLGLASGWVNGDWRTLLLAGGLPPILLAGLAFVLIPKSADVRARVSEKTARLPVLELFAPGLRARTVLLAALTGLNFFGYQAYSGWLSTYLRDVRGLDPTAMGHLVAWQFGANIVGGFVWGWAGDRFGRRFNALGFLAAAAAILLYLHVETDALLLGSIGVAYGFMLSASVIWGPWLTELYPAHLKSTAASIFNWGRLVSFFAPLITGTLATQFGLGVTMGTAAAAFTAAALIWLWLPETHPNPLLPGRRV